MKSKASENHQGERYAITSKGVVHKVDLEGNPDFDGLEFRVIEELSDGYSVYVSSGDPSQPSAAFFISKKYFVEAK